MNHCRFCGLGGGEDAHGLALIKYGVRHYAHPDCLLAAKGLETWSLLHDWQLDNFPYFAARRAGLARSLVEAIRSRKERTTVSR